MRNGFRFPKTTAVLTRTSSADMREGPGEWRSRRYGVIVAA